MENDEILELRRVLRAAIEPRWLGNNEYALHIANYAQAIALRRAMAMLACGCRTIDFDQRSYNQYHRQTRLQRHLERVPADLNRDSRGRGKGGVLAK